MPTAIPTEICSHSINDRFIRFSQSKFEASSVKNRPAQFKFCSVLLQKEKWVKLLSRQACISCSRWNNIEIGVFIVTLISQRIYLKLLVSSMGSNNAPLYMVTWRCTRRCVGNCLYCSYTPEYAKDTDVDTKTACKIVDEIYDFGSPWFGISGGEPLLRQDIFDVIEYAKATGFEVSLITSGFAFDQKRL